MNEAPNGGGGWKRVNRCRHHGSLGYKVVTQPLWSFSVRGTPLGVFFRKINLPFQEFHADHENSVPGPSAYNESTPQPRWKMDSSSEGGYPLPSCPRFHRFSLSLRSPLPRSHLKRLETRLKRRGVDRVTLPAVFSDDRI